MTLDTLCVTQFNSIQFTFVCIALSTIL